jgi:hypothetical protein
MASIVLLVSEAARGHSPRIETRRLAMRDEFDMRLMTEHRSALYGFVEGIVVSLVGVMCQLSAIQWRAPWRPEQPRCR